MLSLLDQNAWRMPNSAPEDLPPAARPGAPPARLKVAPPLLRTYEAVVYSAVRADRLWM
ncbi:hypothetical protein D3C71_2083810 [compost metagenome]